MGESIEVSALIPASAEKIYKAWLSGPEHSKFTGAKAKVTKGIGGEFTAWDNYISGKHLELVPNTKIVQSWRTTEFAAKDPDSKLEVLLKEQKNGTKITIRHSNIPKGQSQGYKNGWIEFYFEPMKKYFG